LYENQMGGDFKFQYKGTNVTCKLNDVILSDSLFKEEKKDIQIFKELNELTPLVQEVITTLNPGLLVSIYGKLYYDENHLEWTI
jgi:hypothetical protein